MWGFISLGSTHCDSFSFFFRCSLVTQCEAPGGMGLDPVLVAGWPDIFLQYFDAVGWVF